MKDVSVENLPHARVAASERPSTNDVLALGVFFGSSIAFLVAGNQGDEHLPAVVHAHASTKMWALHALQTGVIAASLVSLLQFAGLFRRRLIVYWIVTWTLLLAQYALRAWADSPLEGHIPSWVRHECDAIVRGLSLASTCTLLLAALTVPETKRGY